MITPAGTIGDNDTGTPPWMRYANCRGIDPDLFFPEKGAPTAAAKAVCYRCTVRTACLEYALRNGDRDGIWGGTSERQRRIIRKQRADAAGTRVYMRYVA